VWGPRREHYAFALHTYAFLAFALIPLASVFFQVAIPWVAIATWRTYSRPDPVTGHSLGRASLIGRTAGTIALVGVVFIAILFTLSLLELAPAMITAWLQQAAARPY
jgi:hypothetical protein